MTFAASVNRREHRWNRDVTPSIRGRIHSDKHKILTSHLYNSYSHGWVPRSTLLADVTVVGGSLAQLADVCNPVDDLLIVECAVLQAATAT